MKRLLLVSLAAVMLAAPAWAGVGDLAPVTAQPRDAAHTFRYQSYLMARGAEAFSKPIEGAGTVNEHAMVAKLGEGDSVGLLVAIDSAEPNAPAADVLRLDFTGQGKFQDSPIVPLKPRGEGSTAYQVPRTRVDVTRDGQKLTVWVEGMYQKGGSYRLLYLFVRNMVEGDCQFGDQVRRVVLFDTNADLRFDNRLQADAKGFRGDGMAVFQDGRATATGFYGQRIQVGDKWFEITVNDAGTRIAAKSVEVQTTSVRIPHAKWQMQLIGEKYLVDLSGSTEPVQLPPGRYRLAQYVERGEGRSMLAVAGPGEQTLDIAADEGGQELKIGSPLVAKPDVRVMNPRQVYVNLALTDASGNRVGNLSGEDGKQPPEPKLIIRDAEGRQVYSGAMKYG